MTLTFCIPAYNDEKTIETVVKRAINAGKHLRIPYKIYVLNDGSTDRTGAILESINSITVFTHEQNIGYGATMKELYEMANTEWLFSVPGDYQIDPMEVVKLWKYTNTADIILGTRKDRKDNTIRLWHSTLYHALLRLFFNLRIHDVNTVRLAKTNVINVTSTSAFVDAEMLIHAIHNKKKIIEVPIEHMPRMSGVGGGMRLSTSIPVIIDILRTWKKLQFDHLRKQI